MLLSYIFSHCKKPRLKRNKRLLTYLQLSYPGSDEFKLLFRDFFSYREIKYYFRLVKKSSQIEAFNIFDISAYKQVGRNKKMLFAMSIKALKINF